ncbi:zinc finger and SCAN domain-containing protein 21-like [Coccinella septempunctata]|uniref:zinc finger and SCAN domain-containing protein 21-like n=1 Tax=Coccinella septempunctata TaxID=41139 RepID=UPI001D07E271|nr:zinc finger and SCAN domain-containing protein 21-like [Coccinella septempunctata]
MNFPSFGGHFSSGIPNLHQFAAKFSQDNISSNNVASNEESNNARYASNGLSSFSHNHVQLQQPLLTNKYQNNYINQESGNYGPTVPKNDKRGSFDQDLTQEICGAVLHHEEKTSVQKIKQERRLDGQSQITQSNPDDHPPTISTTWQTLTSAGSTVADYLSHLPASTLPLSLHHFLKYSAESIKKETASEQMVHNHNSNMNILQNNSLNISHLNGSMNNAIFNNQVNNLATNTGNSLNGLSSANISNFQNLSPVKKKKKKKVEKEKKPRPKPGEIRLTTALDGSTLYCCPECHMAYPEKELLEQHLLGHTLERRFVCDICGAGLKRKDHLTRHKQSHNPERPYVCTVCLKAFKRKEQLTLHFVIHSGEKRHICPECGKGFYRKDHLRKHTRSHIARRVKAELSQQGGGVSQNSSMSS